MFKIGILGSDNSQALMFAKLCNYQLKKSCTAEVYLYLKEKGCIMNNEVEGFNGENGLYWYTEGGKERKKNEENPADIYVTIAPHKPFIEADMWLACQLKADKNQQIKNSGKGTYSFFQG